MLFLLALFRPLCCGFMLWLYSGPYSMYFAVALFWALFWCFILDEGAQSPTGCRPRPFIRPNLYLLILGFILLYSGVQTSRDGIEFVGYPRALNKLSVKR